MKAGNRIVDEIVEIECIRLIIHNNDGKIAEAIKARLVVSNDL